MTTPVSRPAGQSGLSVARVTVRAVLFDWRGTLVTTLTKQQWVREALRLCGRDADDARAVDRVVTALRRANGPDDRLDGPGVDSDAGLHRRTHLAVCADAGLDPALSEALYAVDSDPRHNSFAVDAGATLAALRARDLRIAVLCDIHFDVRPAFDAAGLGGQVDVFTLSCEQGVQKPHPLMFARTLAALDVEAADALMVGDRSGPDGAAVEHGVPTLLLPSLRQVTQRRLHLVVALCDADAW